MNSIAWTKSWVLWRTMWPALVALAIMNSLIGCSTERPTVFVTGTDYIRLEAGQVYKAPRAMVLGTESLIQRKDQQILDLLRANSKLSREIEFLRGSD